jgi:hypothetical protein
VTRNKADASKPEERIATQFAKWDEAYRERRGIRNVLARPIAKSVRQRIMETYMANAAANAGMVYGDFIQRIVDAAVARYERA